MLFHFDVMALVQTAGYAGLFGIVLSESGLPFGFIFPGDSLLFAAGLFASQGYFNIAILAPLLAMAAILGDSAGYWIGAKAGPAIFKREDSFFFRKEYLERTGRFFERYGARAIVLARFIPVVRTFTPILAGAGSMPYGVFLKYNIIGGIIWGLGIPLLGYTLGSMVPGSERYILPISLFIIVVSFLPPAIEWYRTRKNHRGPEASI